MSLGLMMYNAVTWAALPLGCGGGSFHPALASSLWSVRFYVMNVGLDENLQPETQDY